MAAVKDDLDEGGKATLPRCRHRHRARHVQGTEDWRGEKNTELRNTRTTSTHEKIRSPQTHLRLFTLISKCVYKRPRNSEIWNTQGRALISMPGSWTPTKRIVPVSEPSLWHTSLTLQQVDGGPLWSLWPHPSSVFLAYSVASETLPRIASDNSGFDVTLR